MTGTVQSTRNVAATAGTITFGGLGAEQSQLDLVEAGGWDEAKRAGVVRLEGKDYVVADGDVVVFRFNV